VNAPTFITQLLSPAEARQQARRLASLGIERVRSVRRGDLIEVTYRVNLALRRRGRAESDPNGRTKDDNAC
jgi:hypothetical protein